MAHDVLKAGRRTQRFVITPHWVVFSGASAPAQALYTALQAHVNGEREDGLAWPGMDVLAQILGYRHRQSIAKFVKELVTLGAIDVTVQKWAKGRRNIYTVHETPPDGYQGPRDQADFYRRRKAAAPPADGAVPPAGAALPLEIPALPQVKRGRMHTVAMGSHAHGCENKTNLNKKNNLKDRHSAERRSEMPSAKKEWLTEDNPDLIENICDYVETEVGYSFRTAAMVDAMIDRGEEPLFVLNSALKEAREAAGFLTEVEALTTVKR